MLTTLLNTHHSLMIRPSPGTSLEAWTSSGAVLGLGLDCQSQPQDPLGLQAPSFQLDPGGP